MKDQMHKPQPDVELRNIGLKSNLAEPPRYM